MSHQNKRPPVAGEVFCEECAGEGETQRMRGMTVRMATCPRCHGFGVYKQGNLWNKLTGVGVPDPGGSALLRDFLDRQMIEINKNTGVLSAAIAHEIDPGIAKPIDLRRECFVCSGLGIIVEGQLRLQCLGCYGHGKLSPERAVELTDLLQSALVQQKKEMDADQERKLAMQKKKRVPRFKLWSNDDGDP